MDERVCLGIPTFRRNDNLQRLLAAISRLATLPAGATLEVAVFDNDPAGSAEPVVAASRAGGPFTIHYQQVSPPGLSTVRNAALRFAEATADLLVMIDDDEVPEPQWINELLRIRAATGATAVVGPVKADLAEDAPRWLKMFREREYPIQTDGAAVREGWSSNFLLDLHGIAAGLCFDDGLNHTGGEDQLFFKQMLARGGSIRFAAEAVVWEYLPPSRRAFTAVLRRSFRRGSSLAMCEHRVPEHRCTLVLRFAKGIGLVVIGIATVLPVWLIRGASHAAWTVCEIARGLGMIAAFAGIRYQPYGRRAW